MEKEFKYMSEKDTYSTALLLLFSLSNNPKYSTLSELAYILDHDNFINFMSYYAGQTISIPTKDELNKSLKIMLLYQYHIVEGIEWRTALLKSGFSQDENYSAQRLLSSFRKTLDKYKTGDFINGTKI